jgi:(p)ppGpp synthase/HD superfamily hydrolase
MSNPILPSLIDRAIGYAARAHEGQQRKAGNIPYIAHPVAVAMSLQAMGCGETVIAAALLHDTVEDTAVTLADLRAVFGDEVAEIVAGVTEPDTSRSWEERKQRLIDRFREASLEVKLVAAADKYHNLSHITHSQSKHGEEAWDRFSRGPEQQAWYYREVAASILENVAEPERFPIFAKLQTAVNTLFADVTPQEPIE